MSDSLDDFVSLFIPHEPVHAGERVPGLLGNARTQQGRSWVGSGMQQFLGLAGLRTGRRSGRTNESSDLERCFKSKLLSFNAWFHFRQAHFCFGLFRFRNNSHAYRWWYIQFYAFLHDSQCFQVHFFILSFKSIPWNIKDYDLQISLSINTQKIAHYQYDQIAVDSWFC